MYERCNRSCCFVAAARKAGPVVKIDDTIAAILADDAVATIYADAYSLRQFLGIGLQRLDHKGIMTGGTITQFVVELGIAIVGGVIIAEEARTSHAIELNQIARHVGTDGIGCDATLLESSYLFVQLRLISGKLHIALILCSGIATLEPVAMITLAGWHGRANLLHERL